MRFRIPATRLLMHAFTAVTVAYMGHYSPIYAQAILYNERIDTQHQDVYVRATASSPDGPSDFDETDNTDETLAYTISHASSGTAYSTSQAEAINPTGTNSSTLVPQVDIAASVDNDASLAESGRYRITADAYGQYKVVANPSLPNVTSGELQSELYVVVTGWESDPFPMMDLGSWIRVQSGGSDLQFTRIDGPTYPGWGWYVNGTLRNRAGADVIVDEYLPGGSLNEFYVGTEDASVDDEFILRARMNQTGGTNNSGGATMNRGFSASATYSIHALP